MENKSTNNKDTKRITNSVLDHEGNPVEFDTEKEPMFPFLFRRFIEILIASVIASVPFAILYSFGLQGPIFLKLTGLSLFIFIIINFYLFRSFFYGMGNLKVYYKVNIVAYAIYAIINITVLSILAISIQSGSIAPENLACNSIYSFVFMPFQFAYLIFENVISPMEPKFIILSALLVHIGMYLVIVLSPLEMYAFEKNKRSKRN